MSKESDLKATRDSAALVGAMAFTALWATLVMAAMLWQDGTEYGVKEFVLLLTIVAPMIVIQVAACLVFWYLTNELRELRA